jgi:polyhydroxybutyrate depolymerase
MTLRLDTPPVVAGQIVMQTQAGPRRVLVNPAGSGPRPTVLVLHGAFGSGRGAARTTGFTEAAARRGFTSVFPSGIGRRWHYGPAVRGADPDDLGFLSALVDQLVAGGAADPRRIYLAGISNGGMMTFAMVCKSGQLFAGAATIIANMPTDLYPCVPEPMPWVMINGTADPVMPYAGGITGRRGAGREVWSAEQTAEFLARSNGCNPTPDSQALPRRGGNGQTAVTRITWSGSPAGRSVTLYRVDGGGHTVPGGASSLREEQLGPTSQDIGAAEVIIDTFACDP